MPAVRRPNFKDRIEYAALLAVATLVQGLSVETASRFCAFWWRLIAPRLRRQRRVIEHLKLAFPHLTDREVQKLSIKVWDNLGRVMAETLHLKALKEAALASPRNFSLVPNLDTLLERGAIIVSGHIGAYELVVGCGHMVGLKPCGIYQELSNPLVDDFLTDLRSTLYPAGLFAKSHSTARKVLSIVKSGGTAAFLADHRELRGVPITFFGHTAWCNPFPARLARHCNVLFAVGRVIRGHGPVFYFEGEKVPVPHTDDTNADIAAATQNMHDVLERYIREYPEQWMWAHRKWAPPPPRDRSPRDIQPS